MKQIILLSILSFFLFKTRAQTDYGIIEYKKEKLSRIFTKDKIKRLGDKKFNRFADLEESMNKANKLLVFNLYFRNNESTFEVKPFLESPDQKLLKFSVGPLAKGIYYNSNNQRFRKMNVFGEDFLITYPMPIKWKLENDTKKIGKYLVYKATTTEEVITENKPKKYIITAWYCPEINIPFGPIGYSGLPGLILELEKNKERYFVSKMELNPKSSIKINKPKKGKKITFLEYNKMSLNAMQKYRKIRG